MSAHESERDIETQRTLAIADHESREHEVTVHKKSRGPFADPFRRPSCALCGPIGEWLTDAEDAHKAANSHRKSAAADVPGGGEWR